MIGEPAALERAVTNLLDNAAKWSPPLGVVTVRLVDGTLHFCPTRGTASPRPTCRTCSTASTAPPSPAPLPGSGLGLSIVRQVAERHGGTVRVGVAESGGAAFWMTIPGRVTGTSQEVLSAG